jgi:hypothetical protein
MVLRRILGPKRDEITGEWRKVYNEELHILYSSPNIRQIKENDLGWTCGMHGRGEENVQGFSGKALRKQTTRKGSEWLLEGLAGGRGL